MLLELRDRPALAKNVALHIALKKCATDIFNKQLLLTFCVQTFKKKDLKCWVYAAGAAVVV